MRVTVQVKVLALTDHDTMEGVAEATSTARKLGIRLIPGVEISSIFSNRYSLSTIQVSKKKPFKIFASFHRSR